MLSQRSFIDKMRQYAAKANRKHASYAEVILALRSLRVEAIAIETQSPAATKQALTALDASIMREYAPNDPDFKLPSGEAS